MERTARAPLEVDAALNFAVVVDGAMPPGAGGSPCNAEGSGGDGNNSEHVSEAESVATAVTSPRQQGNGVGGTGERVAGGVRGCGGGGKSSGAGTSVDWWDLGLRGEHAGRVQPLAGGGSGGAQPGAAFSAQFSSGDCVPVQIISPSGAGSSASNFLQAATSAQCLGNRLVSGHGAGLAASGHNLLEGGSSAELKSSTLGALLAPNCLVAAELAHCTNVLDSAASAALPELSVQGAGVEASNRLGAVSPARAESSTQFSGSHLEVSVSDTC